MSVHFFNRFPQLFKDATTPEAFKNGLKGFLTSKYFKMLKIFLNLIGRPLYWLTDPDAEVVTRLACERKREWLDLEFVCVRVN